MDEDLIDILREQIKAPKGRIGLSFEEAAATTELSPELLAQFTSEDRGASGIAAFRISAFLTAPKNHPVERQDLNSIAEALRTRIAKVGSHLAHCDLRIALELSSVGYFGGHEVASLVDAMKGNVDFAVASESQRLLPIIGTEFIQDYLTSTELFETGGMGGRAARSSGRWQ